MKLVLGTVQLGLNYGINNSAGKPSLKTAFDIINRSYELGIDEIDTADAYGEAVSIISTYLSQNPNQKFKVMSKFIGNDDMSYREAFDQSCKKLGLESLDGYYFHRFQDFKKFCDFDYIQDLKRESRLGKFAVSLYSIEELELAIDSNEVDVIQLPLNIFDRSEEKVDLLKRAHSKNKLIYVRSVFLQGLFFKNVNNLPPKLYPLRSALIELYHLVDAYKVDMEDLCLKYVLDLSFVDKVIIGVDSVTQLERNVKSITSKIPDELIDRVLKIKINNPELLNPVNWND